jgi:hypothetical protein
MADLLALLDPEELPSQPEAHVEGGVEGPGGDFDLLEAHDLHRVHSRAGPPRLWAATVHEGVGPEGRRGIGKPGQVGDRPTGEVLVESAF